LKGRADAESADCCAAACKASSGVSSCKRNPRDSGINGFIADAVDVQGVVSSASAGSLSEHLHMENTSSVREQVHHAGGYLTRDWSIDVLLE